MKKFVIETEKLVHNVQTICDRAGVPVIAVLKADGYGFGMLQMARILADNGITMFAVTEPEDALTLRESGFTSQLILVMRSTAMQDEADLVIRANATATIGSPEAAAALSAAAQRRGAVAKAHVKIDTGMGRYGFLPSQYDYVRTAYTRLPNVTVTGIYTHFHSSFADGEATHRQCEQLLEITKRLESEGIEPGLRHAANSSGLFNYDDLTLDAVRIGSAFTGRIHTKQPSGLHRLGYLESRVIEIREVPAKHSVGYGAGYITKRPTKIAVVPVGYTDGFHVEKKKDLYRFRDVIRYIVGELRTFFGKKTITVTVDGKQAPVLGHVGLCHVSLDVTDLDISLGARAVLEVNPLYVSPLVEKEYV